MSTLEPLVEIGFPNFMITVESTDDPEIDDGLEAVLLRQRGVSLVGKRGNSSHLEIVYLLGLDLTRKERIGTVVQRVLDAIEAYYVSYGKSPRFQTVNDL